MRIRKIILAEIGEVQQSIEDIPRNTCFKDKMQRN